jgi:hypothetical protein
MPVYAWLSLDSREVAGDLLGWAENPDGSNDGLRGLVLAPQEFAPQEFAPGHWAENLG